MPTRNAPTQPQHIPIKYGARGGGGGVVTEHPGCELPESPQQFTVLLRFKPFVSVRRRSSDLINFRLSDHVLESLAGHTAKKKKVMSPKITRRISHSERRQLNLNRVGSITLK